MSFNSSSSVTSLYLQCRSSTSSNIIFTTYTFINILFLFPLYVLVLYVGCHRWRRQPMSHSDFFTYNMMLVEITSGIGAVFYNLSILVPNEMLLLIGVLLFSIIFPAETMFHVLTCVERYLAVVHPVTYMKLRETSGVRIRNATTVFVWLLSFACEGLIIITFPIFPNMLMFSFMGVCILIVLFCCLLVLLVLNRPGPGEVGGNKERADQSKQRAFHMIAAIMAALLLRFLGFLVWFSFEYMSQMRGDLTKLCALMISGIWLMVPSSLVLPLLFLHRAEKLGCCRQKTES